MSFRNRNVKKTKIEKGIDKGTKMEITQSIGNKQQCQQIRSPGKGQIPTFLQPPMRESHPQINHNRHWLRRHTPFLVVSLYICQGASIIDINQPTHEGMLMRSSNLINRNISPNHDSTALIDGVFFEIH